MEIKLKKINNLKKVIILFIVLLILFFCFFINNKDNIKSSTLNKDYILNEIESKDQDVNIKKDRIIEIKNYLGTTKKDSSYYFINGYISYIEKDYKNAITNFEKTKELIKKKDSSFLKIYTYIFENECYLKENNYKYLVENSKAAFKYISLSKKYKNDKDTMWRTIRTLTKNNETTEKSIDVLNNYMENTKGLNYNTEVGIVSHLAYLHRLNFKYTQSTYNYIKALDIIKNNRKHIKDAEFYECVIISNIGDLSYILNDLKNAIKCYDKAVNIKIKDKKNNAMAKSIVYINQMTVYIDLGDYDKAIEISKSINELIGFLKKDVKDDIEMLLYQNLASAYTYKKDLNKAEMLLNKSKKILQYDEVEYIKNKELMLKIAYAEFYEEQGNHDEAIQIYEEILKNPLKNDVNIEVQIYDEISNIYLEKDDTQNYIKYTKLATIKKDDFENQLKEEYMRYASKLYESDTLREEQDKNIHNIIFLLVSIILLILILISRVNTIITLKKSNFTDGMTNLYNRKYLDYYMEKNKKNIINKNLSVILTDIDYFKKYNDNYGHIKGDEVIKEVASSIIENIKNYGIAIRYGGEEIVIILPKANIDEAKIIANKIQSSINEKNIDHKHSNVSDKLTISMGIYNKVYLYNDDIYSIIDSADKALYKAKSNGKNRYEIHY